MSGSKSGSAPGTARKSDQLLNKYPAVARGNRRAEPLRAYIAQDNPSAARGVVLRIMRSIDQLLPDNPEMGCPGRVLGTRELVITKTPFLVPYRLQRNVIQICASENPANRPRLEYAKQ